MKKTRSKEKKNLFNRLLVKLRGPKKPEDVIFYEKGYKGLDDTTILRKNLKLWEKLPNEIKKQNAVFFKLIEGLFPRDNKMFCLEILSAFNQLTQTQQSECFHNLIKACGNDIEKILVLWENTDNNIKKDKEDIFFEIINKKIENKDKKISYQSQIWEFASKELKIGKGELFKKLVRESMDNPEILARVWQSTPLEIKEKNTELLTYIITYLKANKDKFNSDTLANAMSTIWVYSGTELRIGEKCEDMVEDLIECCKVNHQALERAWMYSPSRIKKERKDLRNRVDFYLSKKDNESDSKKAKTER